MYKYISDLSPINTRQINTLVTLVFIIQRGVLYLFNFCLCKFLPMQISSISITQRGSL